MKNHVTRLRSEREWTQADLAERVGVSRQTINAIEKEKFDPSLPVAFRIARVFGSTIEDVFIDEEGSAVPELGGEIEADGPPLRVT